MHASTRLPPQSSLWSPSAQACPSGARPCTAIDPPRRDGYPPDCGKSQCSAHKPQIGHAARRARLTNACQLASVLLLAFSLLLAHAITLLNVS